MNIPMYITAILAAIGCTEFILMKFRSFAIQSRLYTEAAEATFLNRQYLPDMWKNIYERPSHHISGNMQPGIMIVDQYGELKLVDYTVLAEHEMVETEQFSSQLSLN
jgi:hypothetical protein